MLRHKQGQRQTNRDGYGCRKQGHRHGYTDVDAHKGTQTHKRTQRGANMDTCRDTDTLMCTDMDTSRYMDKDTDTPGCEHTDMCMDRETHERHTCRQTDTQTQMHTQTYAHRQKRGTLTHTDMWEQRPWTDTQNTGLETHTRTQADTDRGMDADT